jgi:hypothetical protein
LIERAIGFDGVVAAVTSESNDDLVAMSSRQMMVIMMS